MANSAISGLLPAAALDADDLFEVVEDGNSRKATFQQVLDGLLPAWVTPTFAAANFHANDSMTWDVVSGDVEVYAYQLAGRTMFLTFSLFTTTVGGTPSSQLRIKIPVGLFAVKVTRAVVEISDNGGALTFGKAAIVTANDRFVAIMKIDESNWTASTNATSVRGQIFFEVINEPSSEEITINGTDITVTAISVTDLSVAGAVFGVEYGIGNEAIYALKRSHQGAVSSQSITIGASDGITAGSYWSLRAYYNLTEGDPQSTRVYGAAFVVAV